MADEGAPASVGLLGDEPVQKIHSCISNDIIQYEMTIIEDWSYTIIGKVYQFYAANVWSSSSFNCSSGNIF